MKKLSMHDLEDLRTELATKRSDLEFKQTYKQNGTINKNTGNFWDKKFNYEEKYENQDAMTREKIDFIISLLPDKKSMILDVGIGQGYLEQRLKQKGIDHNIYGLDISRKSIERARKNLDGIFEVGDILKENKLYKRNFYDVIVAIEVIEHIPPLNIFPFYKRVHDSLRKNGIFIISTPLNEGLRFMKTNPSAHVREFTIPILKAEFKLAKFNIQEYKTLYAFKSNYSLKKLVANFIKRWKPNNIIIKATRK